MLRAIYDTHRVRIRPEGNIGGPGANHDPGDSSKTLFCFGGKFKLAYLKSTLKYLKTSEESITTLIGLVIISFFFFLCKK